MRIAVIGSGAIGNLVAGYLKVKGEEVFLTGKPASIKAIRDKGLIITGVRGDFNINIDTADRLSAPCDLAILAVKTQDIERAIADNKEFLKDSIILTTQNGVQSDNLAAGYLPKQNIVSSIVMFGSTYLEPGKVVHNFEGNWIIGSVFDCCSKDNIDCAGHILREIFPVTQKENIKGMKYLKIFVNANNCIPAILGKSMQDTFSDSDVSRVSIAIWKEGLEIVNKLNIKLESLPDFPLERLTNLVSLPSLTAAGIFSGIMRNLSKEPLYGSILQSIKRGKPSEIDYINGEFIRLAKENNLNAPLNEKLVGLVHRVENEKKFFSKKELLSVISN